MLTPLLTKATTLCTPLHFCSFPRSAWECRVDARRPGCPTLAAERLRGIPTRSVETSKREKTGWSRGFSRTAIKLRRIGVQTFRFGRDWFWYDGVAKAEALDSNAVTFLLVPTLRVGIPSGRSASRVSHARRGASPRHSHAERGNEKINR